MIQSVLADRFKMVAHSASKDADGYALTVRKGGAKIAEAKENDKPAALPEWSRDVSIPDFEGKISATMLGGGVIAVTGRRVTMSQLAQTLQRVTGEPVWDRTGLSGNYYFAFRYAPDEKPDTDAPSLGKALKENLGLQLEKQKGPVETLVVDRIEKTPGEN